MSLRCLCSTESTNDDVITDIREEASTGLSRTAGQFNVQEQTLYYIPIFVQKKQHEHDGTEKFIA